MNFESSNAQLPRKRLWRSASIVLALLLIGGAAFWLSRPRMPLATDPPVEITRFVATDWFASLPGEQKQAYVDRLEKLTFDERRAVAKEANLSPEQALTAYRNVFRQAAMHRIDTYFAITDEEQRLAYLDHIIDEYEKEQTFRKREPLTPAQIKAQLESIPPGQRAKTAQFLSVFVQRRLVRGLGLFQN